MMSYRSRLPPETTEQVAIDHAIHGRHMTCKVKEAVLQCVYELALGARG